ncbi:hypothetical protein KO361_02185 [Candidatus Woesearchaeota archaeon]|nr:hypothetical protein [Candidatus Woesearchaeota archaeon]
MDFAILDLAFLFFLSSSYSSFQSKDVELSSNIVEKEYSVSSLDSLVNLESARYEFESKRIPVLMFHNFADKEDRYTISPENFKKLLFDLYVNDFYSVSLSEFYEGDFSKVPVGKKPVLFTFDDAGPGQFMLRSDGSICDNSAVGILEKFYDDFDFGRGGVFFVSYGTPNNFRLPFMQDDLASDKMKMLVDLGYDLAHHTVLHPNNARASKNNIFEQHVLSEALFHYLLGDRVDKLNVSSFAHPFGASPSNGEVFDYLSGKYDVVFDAWGGASRHSLSSSFDKYRIPRIEITYHTRNLVVDSKDLYVVTDDTKNFYAFKHGFQRSNSDLKRISPLFVDRIKESGLVSPLIFY